MPKLRSIFLVAALFFILGIYFLVVAKKNAEEANYINEKLEEPLLEELPLLEGSSMMPEEDLKSLVTAKIPKDNFLVIENGQSMHGILSTKNISSQEIHALSTALAPYLRARDLAKGDLYKMKIVEHQKNSPILESFTIKKLDANRLPITYEATRVNTVYETPKFKIALSEAAIKEELVVIRLDVSGTLFRSFMSLPFGNELMQRLMHVFTWRMKMPDEVLSKDHIEILVNKRFAENNFIGYGGIQSVYYRQSQRTLFASHFKSKDGKINGFFDEHGKSLEKEFLLSPVYETVATSEQNWRVHPVMKKRIRHNGTDFRGTIGTDFFAIADGEVIEKRFDRMVGNMIRIRHKYGLHSEYFHADSLVDTIFVGSRVKRGQKLGGIGNTGVLCTGPHLHLGLYQLAGEKRKYVTLTNFRKRLLDMPNLGGQYLVEFQEQIKKSMTMMESLKAIALTQNTPLKKVIE